MAIRGDARTRIIRAFATRTGFCRGSNAMSAYLGSVSVRGEMPDNDWTQYRQYADDGKVFYTVRSYDTVIAYVLHDDTVIVPDVRYSPTTSGHQSLCRAYL